MRTATGEIVTIRSLALHALLGIAQGALIMAVATAIAWPWREQIAAWARWLAGAGG